MPESEALAFDMYGTLVSSTDTSQTDLVDQLERFASSPQIRST